MKCTNCGAENPDDSAFCINCGQPLKAATVNEPAQSETPDAGSQADETNAAADTFATVELGVSTESDAGQANMDSAANVNAQENVSDGNYNPAMAQDNASFNPQAQTQNNQFNAGGQAQFNIDGQEHFNPNGTAQPQAQFTPGGTTAQPQAQFNPGGTTGQAQAQFNPGGQAQFNPGGQAQFNLGGQAQFNPGGNVGQQAQAQFNAGGNAQAQFNAGGQAQFNPNGAAQGQAQFNQGFAPNGAPGQQMPPKQPLTPEQKKKYTKFGLIGCVAAAVVIVFIIIGVNASHTINLNKYTTIKFDGYDTVGKATIDFDSDKFYDDYGKKIKYKKGNYSESDLLSALSSYDAYEALCTQYIDASLDKSSGLSNGDKVTLKWDCDDKAVKQYFGYKLKYKDITEKVSGLKKAEKFDPFDGVDVTFSGIAPNGKAEVDGESSEAPELSYSLDKNSGLSNGDKVTLTVNAGYSGDVIDYCIENYGKIPSPTTKEYTVSGLGSYLNSAKDLSDDDLNTLKNYAETEMNKRIADNWGDNEQLVSMDYIGNYFQKIKEGTSYYWDENALCLVYKIVVNDSSGDFNQDTTYYTYVCFKDVQTDGDGKLVTTNMDYGLTSHTFDVEGGGHWWYYYGYETLDVMKNDLVDSDYDLEENISE